RCNAPACPVEPPDENRTPRPERRTACPRAPAHRVRDRRPAARPAGRGPGMKPEAAMFLPTLESPGGHRVPDWRDGGLEAAPLGLDLPVRGLATESDADPSWQVL